MNWIEPILRWGVSVLFLVLLILVYMKKADKSETYIGWKMIGFFLLGTFTFRLQGWVLPVGIAVFLLYFLPKLYQNKTVKKWAAFLGVVSFLSNIVIANSVEVYHEREITVKASETNAFYMKFSKDYEKIKGALNANGDLVINSFELSFKKDGKIQQYNYSVLYELDGRKMMAWVEQTKDVFKISPQIQQEEEIFMDSGMNYISTPKIYFQALDLHGLKKMIPEGDLYHVGFSNNDGVSPGQEKSALWDIQTSGIVGHEIETMAEEDGTDTSFPYHINITSMKKTGPGSYTGDHYDYYSISSDLFE